MDPVANIIKNKITATRPKINMLPIGNKDKTCRCVNAIELRVLLRDANYFKPLIRDNNKIRI